MKLRFRLEGFTKDNHNVGLGPVAALVSKCLKKLDCGLLAEHASKFHLNQIDPRHPRIRDE